MTQDLDVRLRATFADIVDSAPDPGSTPTRPLQYHSTRRLYRSAAVTVSLVLAIAGGVVLLGRDSADLVSTEERTLDNSNEPAADPADPSPTASYGELVEPKVIPIENGCPGPLGSVPGRDVEAEAERVAPMVDQVVRYGATQPEEFGSYGIAWSGQGAAVVASFTSNLPSHRVALRDLVDFPDDLVVCQTALSAADSEQLRSDLEAELTGSGASVSQGIGAVEVVLASSDAAVAQDLFERYGDALQITVGALPFPPEPRATSCVDLPNAADAPFINFTINPLPGPVRPASLEAGTLTVHIENAGSERITLASQAAVAAVVDSRGAVVSDAQVAMPTLGIGVELEAGESIEMPLIVNLASCSAALGYVLPSGPYELVATIPFYDGQAIDHLQSEAIEIEIGE